MSASQVPTQPALKRSISTATSTKRPSTDEETSHKRQRLFTSALADYARGDAFSDFEIVCNGVTFPVHRLVISMHSSFFERLCKSSFKESDERSVDLSVDPLAAVCLMISYFYKFEYSADDFDSLVDLPAEVYGPRTHGWGWFLIHAQLVVLADKYDIKGLGAHAMNHFQDSVLLATGPRDPPSLNSDSFAAAAADLIKATRWVYDNTYTEKAGLRRAIVDAYQLYRHRLMRYAKRDAFKNLLSDAPDFACDLLDAATCITVGRKKVEPTDSPRQAVKLPSG